MRRSLKPSLVPRPLPVFQCCTPPWSWVIPPDHLLWMLHAIRMFVLFLLFLAIEWLQEYILLVAYYCSIMVLPHAPTCTRPSRFSAVAISLNDRRDDGEPCTALPDPRTAMYYICATKKSIVMDQAWTCSVCVCVCMCHCVCVCVCVCVKDSPFDVLTWLS